MELVTGWMSDYAWYYAAHPVSSLQTPEQYLLMKDTGVNIIRLALDKTLSETIPEYIPLIDKIVSLAGGVGIKICLDLHAGFTFEQLYSWVAVDPTEFINWWTTLLSRYKNDPTVAMIDLCNEPAFYKGSPTGLTEEQIYTLWRDFCKRVIPEIQAVNPNLVISVETYGFDMHHWTKGWIDLPNIVYAFHDYYNSALRYPRPIKWAEAYRDGRLEEAKKLLEEDWYARYLWVPVEQNKPVWNSEIGVVYGDPTIPNSLYQIRDVYQLLAKYESGLAQWVWHASMYEFPKPGAAIWYLMLEYDWKTLNPIGQMFKDYAYGQPTPKPPIIPIAAPIIFGGLLIGIAEGVK
jgi:hypothetical protein